MCCREGERERGRGHAGVDARGGVDVDGAHGRGHTVVPAQC